MVTAARVLGLLLTVTASVAVYWMTTSGEFRLDEARITGDLRYTSGQELLAAAGLAGNSQVLRIDTIEARRRILDFPSVADAQVRVLLPDEVVVTVVERTPVFALRHQGQNLLVDDRGAIVAAIGDTEAASLGIPVVRDDRADWAIELVIGATVDPIDLAAVLQLAALQPATLGSSASSLTITIDDDDGYVITGHPFGWRAIFGQYTPTLRPPDLVARQVQCLRSLLAGGEEKIDTIYLAPLEERCGTYLPRETPRSSPTPEPSA